MEVLGDLAGAAQPTVAITQTSDPRREQLSQPIERVVIELGQQRVRQ